MAIKILQQVEEPVAAKLPVEQVQQEAMKAGAKGLRILVDGALTAVKAVEERLHINTEPLQEAIAELKPEQAAEATTAQPIAQAQPVVEDSAVLQQQIHATAERVLDEARAVEERLHAGHTAKRPIQVTVEADARPKARTQGRKTVPTANVSAKRVTAPTGGFKAKRGQKHTHSH